MEAMLMEGKVSNWNDDRLDELNGRVGDGFAKVDKRFERVEGEMKEGFAKVDREMKAGFAKVDKEIKEGFAEVREEMRYLGERFDRLLHALAVSAVGFAGAILAAIGGRIFF